MAAHEGEQHHNLFLVLGKYVERQEENLLTQAVVLLFNRCAPFRESFCGLLRAEDQETIGVPADGLTAESQVPARAHGRNIVVDMLVRERRGGGPLYLVEAKLDAPLGKGQLRRYGQALGRLGGKTRLVVITRFGADDDLWRDAPAGTVWLSWPLVVESSLQARGRARALDRLLIDDFVRMAKMKGIESVPSMSRDYWRLLGVMSDFVLLNSRQRRSVRFDALAACEIALMRMQWLRDSAWSRNFKRGVWQPYHGAYKPLDVDDDGIYLEAGFSRSGKKKHVNYQFFGLELYCGDKPLLYAVGGWKLKKSHPRYAKAHQAFEWKFLEEWTAAGTRKIFHLPMSTAGKLIAPRLQKASKTFFTTLYGRP